MPDLGLPSALVPLSMGIAMASHLSTLGFEVETEDDMLALANDVVDRCEVIGVKGGEYRRWVGSGGEELWLQLDRHGDLIGFAPHFGGDSTVRVGLTARVRRDRDTPLDGAFHAWASPDGDPASGAYPLVFDAPDAAVYADLAVPGIADAAISAFAAEIELHASPEAFEREAEEPGFATRSFIPSGTFTPDGDAIDPPDAEAIIGGHVIEADTRTNEITGRPFYRALVESYDASFDVVIDPAIVERQPRPGEVVLGGFWLTGRLRSYPRKERTTLGRLLGRG